MRQKNATKNPVTWTQSTLIPKRGHKYPLSKQQFVFLLTNEQNIVIHGAMKGNRRDRLMWTESQFVSCSAAWKTNTQHIVRSVCEHTQRRAQTHPVIMNHSRIQTTCFSANPEPDRIISHEGTNVFLLVFILGKLTTLSVLPERKDTTTNSFSIRTVSHTQSHTPLCVRTSMRRLCISSLSVFLSCISWFCLASSSHTCWALLWQWRSNCCSLQRTRAHTHTILTERVWEERTLLANIKPNVVNIERELDPQRAFNITGLCFDQAINSVYRDTSAV